MQYSQESVHRETPVSCPPPNPVLRHLVRAIHAAVDGEPDPARKSFRAARALQPFLGDPRLLEPEQREPDPANYRQHRLYVADDGSFSIVALVWMPGQATSIHDHVSWCAIGIHEGVEEEVQYRLVEERGESWLVPAGACVNPQGAVEALTPPGDIHHVSNPGPDIAISIHVYGADVRERGTSIRRRYDLEVRPAEYSPVH